MNFPHHSGLSLNIDADDRYKRSECKYHWHPNEPVFDLKTVGLFDTWIHTNEEHDRQSKVHENKDNSLLVAEYVTLIMRVRIAKVVIVWTVLRVPLLVINCRTCFCLECLVFVSYSMTCLSLDVMLSSWCVQLIPSCFLGLVLDLFEVNIIQSFL